MNRLAQARSPYLLQHRDNPVHWWEWGPEALAEAKRLHRPILLSAGYAACHWCHVMAHESFEDDDVAAVMNAHFVNIKVDREERPDIDHIYMSALHLLGEQGGWPLTMFLTEDAEPFWGGTYFPKEPNFGRPGFVQLLKEINRLYRDEPQRVLHNRQLLLERLAEKNEGSDTALLSLEDLTRFGRGLCSIMDGKDGGIRGAPKFPNPTLLECLIRQARRAGDKQAEGLFLLSLERMALGGIRDHLGGGFARYSVDGRWLVPHFEKMLYDNAQLLDLYALAAHDTGKPLFRETAQGIVAWLEREMITEQGGFSASLDADSEGEEGRFYVWSIDEIREALGEHADAFIVAYDIQRHGNWEETNIPNLLDTGPLDPELEARMAPLRAKLLDRRSTRVRPGLDDKVLADWNGLMIVALVRASLLLREPDWMTPAIRAFDFIAESMGRDGRLGHSWRDGRMIFPGFALDHAAMMRAALALHEATGEKRYLSDALTWRDVIERDYRTEGNGPLAMTARDAETLVMRPQPLHDDAVPNANGVYAEALVRLSQLTGKDEHREHAEQFLSRLCSLASASPLGHGSVMNALDLHLRGLSIVISGDNPAPLRDAALALSYLDRSVSTQPANQLDEGHPAQGAGADTAGTYALVCASMRCSLPVSTPDALHARARQMLTESVT
jgi:uncharacterized protein YyaL (SSP411 family)